MPAATAATPEPAARPRRDADRSREALLAAAAELFDDRGYDRTTVREIGSRAGVDPSLIARYFDGKPGLYLAVMRRENATSHPADLLATARVRGLVELIDRRGPGPVFRSAVQQTDDAPVEAVARETLHRRIVDPLLARLQAAGVPDAQLRAEAGAAAVIGITLARHTGNLAALRDATVDEVVAVVEKLLPGLLER
jgi:AcrR family transcriptional regulator